MCIRDRYTGGFQRGIFAQRETGHISGLDPLLGQNGGYAAGKGHHAGVGVFLSLIHISSTQSTCPVR